MKTFTTAFERILLTPPVHFMGLARPFSGDRLRLRSLLIALLLWQAPWGAAWATPLTLADSPLFLLNNARPNTLINLSVESPMIGAAYNDQNDIGAANSLGCTGRPSDESGYGIGACYKKTNSYIGYFDANKCYVYSSTNSQFEPSSTVLNSNHECSGKWSGNFLNWATMTAIDEFRYALTGGNRSTDTATLTSLKRANENLGKGHSWFPLKKIGTNIGPGNVDPSTVTPYSVTTLYINNYDTRMDVATDVNFSSSTAAVYDRRGRLVQPATTGSKLASALNVIVKVCDSGVSLETNCRTYGSSKKPTGVIQNNSDSMRFALTSYLIDSNQSRDGGVLRANIKFAGPNQYVNGIVSSNPNTEWSSSNGILVANPNPDDATASSVSNSGIINYINKFGYANGYKSYDPIGEIYYEALRYFKHLGGTPEDSNNLNDTMKDGFPVITSWTDPIQYACQKNFIVSVQDANPWLDKRLPGTAFTTSSLTNTHGTTVLTAGDYGEPTNADPTINVTTLTNRVGDLEGLTNTQQCIGGDNSSTASGFDGNASNKNVSALGKEMGTCPYPPKQNSYYIAGLAYYANTQDIRTEDRLPGTQTVATYMIDTQEYNATPLIGQMNMLWLAGKYGGFIDSNGNARPDLQSEWDSNSDGIPDNYVLASRPDSFIRGLSAAFSNIISRTSNAAAALSTNSGSIQTGTTVFQAQFNSTLWSGHFYDFTVNGDGTVVTTRSDGSSNANWDAATLLPAADSRNILTYNGTQGVTFAWANLTTAQQTQLETDSFGNLGTASHGQDVLNYLRGDASKEARNGGSLRNRTDGVLGDIVNSDPMYTKNEDYGYKNLPSGTTGQSTYAAYVTSKANRTPMIYVGANDGMLHGFRADLGSANSGKELIAYIPKGVYANLSKLAETSYSHTYYVDGGPNVHDAYLSGGWTTVLVGGLNKGGKSIYALDVSNPGSSATTQVLWEYSDSSTDANGNVVVDADLGLTYSQPQIGLLKDGTWAAIFGNGYNSTSEKAFLYIVNLRTGALIKKIPTNSTTANGLSTPVLYSSGNNMVIDYVYAGDLQGNLWKFDLSSTSQTAWGLGNGGQPLFTAVVNDVAQPITEAPVIGSNTSGGPLIFFGTGRYLTVADVNNVDQQTFYAIWDKPGFTGTVTRDNLVQQTITETVAAGTTLASCTNSCSITYQQPVRGVSTHSVDYTTKRGWYLDLISGERVVSSALIKYDRVIFLTAIPSTDPCTPGGISWLMELSLMTGGAASTSPFDFNNDNSFNSGDRLPSGSTAAGVQSNVGMVKSAVWLENPSVAGTAYKEMSGTTGNIMTEKNRGCTSNCSVTLPATQMYWLQIQ